MPSASRSDDFYRAVFEVNSAVKLLIRPDTGQIVDANEAASAFYGWSLDQLRTMRITEINCLTGDEVRAEMENARTLRRRYFEFRHRTAGGDIRHVEVHSGPVRFEGEELLFSIVHDVTERNLLSEQLRQARRLESIGRLAGGVAHDFNNLLTVILTSASFMNRRLKGDPDLAPYLDDVRHAARRAADLTSSLLSFGRQQLLQPKVLSINPLVDRMARILSRTVAPSIDVSVSLAPEDPRVHADPSQLEQVIMNLALNARDAMPCGGTITLGTRATHVDCDGAVAAGEWVEIWVTDTGEGMDDDTRARVFEPFFTTKEVGAGTGLGLASVYGVIRQSGGQITVDSAPGLGSTFTVHLARSHGCPYPDSEELADPVAAPSNRTLLVVEDIDRVRAVMADALASSGFRVVQAASAEAALALPAEELARVDAVISDIVMAGRSGVDLAIELLKVRPHLPVLLVSGHTCDHDDDRLPDHVAFLAKPFDAAELLGELQRILPEADSDG